MPGFLFRHPAGVLHQLRDFFLQKLIFRASFIILFLSVMVHWRKDGRLSEDPKESEKCVPSFDWAHMFFSGGAAWSGSEVKGLWGTAAWLRDVLFCTFIHSRIRRAFTERSVSGAALGARDTVSTHLPGAWGLVGKRTMWRETEVILPCWKRHPSCPLGHPKEEKNLGGSEWLKKQAVYQR